MKNLNQFKHFILLLTVLTVTACGGGGGGTPPPNNDATIPIEPGSLVASTLSAASIRVTWLDNSDDEDGFRVERSLATDTGFEEIATIEPDVVMLDDTDLSADTPYYYRVMAFNTAGASVYSNVASATTHAAADTPPAPPTELQATALSSSSIKLTWTDNATNEDEYIVMHASFSGTCGAYSPVATLSPDTTIYVHSGLASSSSHCYQVIAQNGAGSGNSNIVEGVQTSVAVYTLTVSTAGIGFGEVTGTGINCPGDCSASVAHGTSITLTATATGVGSSFASWSGCNSVSGNQCTVKMNADRAVTATFDGNPN